MTDSDIQTETWKPIPGFAIRYQASDRGRIRNKNGLIMQARPNSSGYLQINLRDDSGKTQTVTVHSLILTTFAGPRPPGAHTCHGPGGQHDNRWPENLRWCTKSENEREKIADGYRPPVTPTFECLNFASCGNLVINEGRRCVACVNQVAEEAAAMLGRRVNLMDVAEHFGYTNPDWVWQLAVKRGGWTGTKRDALTQQPPLSRRVTAKLTATLRSRGRGR